MSDHDEKPEATEPPEETPPAPKWEYKTEFGINEKMKSVVDKAITLTASQIEDLRRKLDRLTYGS